MKVLFFVLIMSLPGCDNKSSSVYEPGPGGDPELEASYAEVSDIIIATCLVAGCHANGAKVDLQSGVALQASKAQVRLENGSMPPPNSGPAAGFTEEMREKLLSFFN